MAARGIAADAISRLAKRGYISLRQDRVDRDPFDRGQIGVRSGSDPDLTPEDRQLTGEQADALARLRKLAGTRAFHVALLHGVTGSGKTEVYIRLSAEVRDAGRRVLMLVPEIALTPAAAALFRQAFGERVAIQHSGLSDGERHDQWQRIRRGDIDIVVGTRSAVFAPLENVGLIVVDEEHDGSYKQEESPRYNGRDVAIVRAQRAGALVVLGSATPSMESYHHAMTGKYERIVLERRVLDRPLASVSVVDMREEYAAEGPDVILSRALREGLQTRLDRHEQSLVLLNRRGFATAVFCRQCAGTIDCPNCSVSLVVHGEGNARRARCHYCNYTSRVPASCPLCAGPYLEQAGFGTERVEAEVKKACPGARVARLDRDAIRRKGSLGALLARFRSGAIDVLVGTQMIAKGHDFPARHAGRRRLRRRRPRPRRLPRLRAHVPAADAGRRPRRPRRAGRRSDRPDAVSRPLQHPAGVPAGLPGVLRARDALPPRDALSADDLAGQRGRPFAHVRRRDGRRVGDR